MPARANHVRDDVLAEIDVLFREPTLEHVAVENVDAHRREQQVARRPWMLSLVSDAIVHAQGVEDRILLRLLHEAGDPLLAIDLHDAERARVIAIDGNGRDRHIGARQDVLFDHSRKFMR